jgi:hypothetical protein
MVIVISTYIIVCVSNLKLFSIILVSGTVCSVKTFAFTEAIYFMYDTPPYTLLHLVFKTDKAYGEPSE